MPNIGAIELLVLIGCLVILGALAALVIVLVNSKSRRTTPPHSQQHGGPPTAPPAVTQPARDGADLATRARRLTQQGRAEEAVHLFVAETGMEHGQARAFVNALEDPTRS